MCIAAKEIDLAALTLHIGYVARAIAFACWSLPDTMPRVSGNFNGHTQYHGRRGVCVCVSVSVIAQVIAHSIYSIRQREIVSVMLIMPLDTSLPSPPPYSVHANYIRSMLFSVFVSTLGTFAWDETTYTIQHLYDSNHSPDPLYSIFACVMDFPLRFCLARTPNDIVTTTISRSLIRI